MGLFDFIKKAFGAKGTEAPSVAASAPAVATPTPPDSVSGIPGWRGPATDDPEASMEAHKLMSWVVHEGFTIGSYEADTFEQSLELLESRSAHADLIEVLKRAAIKLPAHPPLWRRLAQLYTDQYDNDSAATIWRKLIDMDAYQPEANERLGEIAERKGEAVEAAAYYQRAIVYDANNEVAWRRAETLKVHIPMPRKAAAATLGGAEAGAHLEGLGIRAPEGYELDHPLGRGSYGTVYLARDKHLHRDVAIKFLHPHLTRDTRRVEAFFDEARLVARLALPGVVRIYDLDEAARVIVMEYLTRGTLRDRLASGRALAPRAALRVGISLLRTLGRLHKAGIIHRDLKPENILFRTDGSAVLGDFGVAALEDQTTATRAAGTLAYMAPEQKQPSPDLNLDRRADLYAVGLILVEMLAGGLPVGAATRIHPPEVFLAMLPPYLGQIVNKPIAALLSIDPAERPSDASKVMATLRALSRQIAAQNQTGGLVEELEKLISATSPDDHEARAQLDAMRRALASG